MAICQIELKSDYRKADCSWRADSSGTAVRIVAPLMSNEYSSASATSIRCR